MSKNIIQALPELVQAGIILPETADQIRDYYRQREGKPANVLFIVFGILGALLVGLGIILMLAHNWDELPRPARTALAFMPLVLGQLLAAYVLVRKSDSRAWRESAATFLLLAVGACMALVSQIYHIPGQLSAFLFTWMLLGLPLVYLLRASMVSLLYLAGITWFAVVSREDFVSYSGAGWYWLLLPGVIPHYYRLYRQTPGSNFTLFHHWLLPLSLAIALVTVGEKKPEWLVLAFSSLFGLFCLIGYSPALAGQKRRTNGYILVGTAGSIGLLLTLSFDFFWVELTRQRDPVAQVISAPEGWAAALVTLLALGVLAGRLRHQPLTAFRPMEAAFVFFTVIFFLAFLGPSTAMVLVNLLVLCLGLLTMQQGARQQQLGQLNYGLLLVTALITCRFFDTELSFIIRGLLFVLVGAGFFGANYWMLQKRKIHAK